MIDDVFDFGCTQDELDGKDGITCPEEKRLHVNVMNPSSLVEDPNIVADPLVPSDYGIVVTVRIRLSGE